MMETVEKQSNLQHTWTFGQQNNPMYMTLLFFKAEIFARFSIPQVS